MAEFDVLGLGDEPLHDAFLNNPEADARLAEIAIRGAVARGAPPEYARRLYEVAGREQLPPLP